MCPDDRILSSFMDHELPSVSSERVEEHVSICEDCRTRLRRYQSISHRLLECDEPDVEEVGMRIWRRIETQAPNAPAWRRWLPRLPIPQVTVALAMAVVFTIGIGAGLFDRMPVGRDALQPVALARTDPPFSPLVTGEDRAEMELDLSYAGHFRLLSSPTIVRERELLSSAPPQIVLDTAVITMKVQLPPARYRIVGMPTILHETELQTSKP